MLYCTLESSTWGVLLMAKKWVKKLGKICRPNLYKKSMPTDLTSNAKLTFIVADIGLIIFFFWYCFNQSRKQDQTIALTLRTKKCWLENNSSYAGEYLKLHYWGEHFHHIAQLRNIDNVALYRLWALEEIIYIMLLFIVCRCVLSFDKLQFDLYKMSKNPYSCNVSNDKLQNSSAAWIVSYRAFLNCTYNIGLPCLFYHRCNLYIVRSNFAISAIVPSSSMCTLSFICM